MVYNCLKMTLFFFLFVLYWGLLGKLVGSILLCPRLKFSHWLWIGFCNGLILLFIWSFYPNAQLSFWVMLILMLGEFLLFYRDRFAGTLLCVLACCIHIITALTILLGVFSLRTGSLPSEILTDGRSFLWCCTALFLLLDLLTLGALTLVPLSMVKLINQHREQQRFVIGWMTVSCLCLLYMESLLHQSTYPPGLAGSQMVVSIAMLIGLYIVIFFSIKTSSLLGYKEKNAELELAIQKEQEYRNLMVRDAIASYEINVTQDLLLKGFEEQRKNMGEAACCYTDMLILMSQQLIYSEDIAAFVRDYGRTNILRLFEKGECELNTEYRRLLQPGEYVWVRSIINLFREAQTNDVKAFIYVKNIDAEKKKQLELQRQAERDPLTGLYNRSFASKLIDEHLTFAEKPAASALFIIDLDNFKDVNDYMGHVFGDAVLCELADKLVHIFRSNDITARIGGDEYIVFLTDGVTPRLVEEKAKDICKAFQVTYQHVGDSKFTISASIGVAFSPHDGNNFQELYAHADISLYSVKNGGKNGYKFYDGGGFEAYTSKRTEIQAIGNVTQKGFRENRIEYVFKILYQSENPVSAIHSVLELVARHFSFERGYIFETSKDGKSTSNTFEWCAEDVTPEIHNLQSIPIAAVATAHEHFQRCGTFVLRSLDDLRPHERAVLEPQGIKSMFQFGIFDKSRLLGFIGFDNCRSETIPSDFDIDEMKTICNILATFFVKQYVDEVASKDLLARQEVMNHLENYIYVINTETFELLFMNEKIQTLLESADEGDACYRFFRGKTEQCEDCPMHRLVHTEEDRIVCEIYNDKLNIWTETTASLMRWTDGSLACLINCSNITKQKEDHLQHVCELERLLYVDTLAGCPTYHKFQIDAQHILEQQADKAHLLVKLDIDNFKLINQMYGYAKGNDVLCCVANALAKTMRSEYEIFARVANDEFVTLLTVSGEEEIEDLNKRFLSHFHHLVGSDFSFKCRFPHGRYLISPHDIERMGIHDMFEKANVAHKAAKSEKTVDFVFYDESMTKEALRVRAIENNMTQALANHEFTVYLQPKYYLKDETIGGAEALTRWQNENMDLFFPSTFIPVFEQNGFITKLDFYVFEQTCRAIKSWIDQGIAPVTVSVNFSRLHLDNTNFVKELCQIVDGLGIDRQYLEIEITETVIFDNIDSLESLLEEVHKSGFSMSMDDFGSGYSSLGMLKDFPVDVIKMDRSFFVNQRDAERSKIVVGSIIQMAASLGIRIVAEGVEEQSHIDFLRELNCDMVQGYYYAKPMTVSNFTQLLCRERGKKDEITENKENRI